MFSIHILMFTIHPDNNSNYYRLGTLYHFVYSKHVVPLLKLLYIVTNTQVIKYFMELQMLDKYLFSF